MPSDKFIMQCLEGNTDAAEAHIRGLMILMKTKLPQDHGLYQSAQILLRLGLLYEAQIPN